MMASRRHGTLYIGVTSGLLRRVSQHREDMFDGFTKRGKPIRSGAAARIARMNRASRGRQLFSMA